MYGAAGDRVQSVRNVAIDQLMRYESMKNLLVVTFAIQGFLQKATSRDTSKHILE